MLHVLIKGDSRFPVSRKVIKQAVVKVIKEQGLLPQVEVSVRIGGDRLLRRLNRSYRNINSVPQVLSFPQQEDGPVRFLSSRPSSVKLKSVAGFVTPPDQVLYLGDIVISYPQARLAAARENTLVEIKISELVAHGVKHLLGEHH